MHEDSDADIFDAVVHIERDAFRFGVESARASPSVGSEQFEEGRRAGYVDTQGQAASCKLAVANSCTYISSQFFSWL
jgi:hypothetical protein